MFTNIKIYKFLHIYNYFPSWRCGQTRSVASLLLTFLDHTQQLPHSVGQICTPDQPVAKASDTLNIHKPGDQNVQQIMHVP